MLFSTGCGTAERERNQENLKLLRQGMTKAQVKTVMGTALTKEIYNTDNIWYYYTGSKWRDSNTTRDECTPLVFEDGKLLGWGHPFLKKYNYEKW